MSACCHVCIFVVFTIRMHLVVTRDTISLCAVEQWAFCRYRHIQMFTVTPLQNLTRWLWVVCFHSQVTQEISDPSRVFRLLGSDRLVQTHLHRESVHMSDAMQWAEEHEAREPFKTNTEQQMCLFFSTTLGIFDPFSIRHWWLSLLCQGDPPPCAGLSVTT